MNKLISALEEGHDTESINLINAYLAETDKNQIRKNNYHLLFLDKIKRRISRQKRPSHDFIQARMTYFKNQNFGQKSKFWSIIKMLVNNQNFGQKSKFWSIIKMLVKNTTFTCFYFGTNDIFCCPHFLT